MILSPPSGVLDMDTWRGHGVFYKYEGSGEESGAVCWQTLGCRVTDGEVM